MGGAAQLVQFMSVSFSGSHLLLEESELEFAAERRANSLRGVQLRARFAQTGARRQREALGAWRSELMELALAKKLKAKKLIPLLAPSPPSRANSWPQNCQL